MSVCRWQRWAMDSEYASSDLQKAPARDGGNRKNPMHDTYNMKGITSTSPPVMNQCDSNG
ncbi:hypothetical protein MGG_16367 [Pyricularia oryzae 70-15]|uniref:Uncharacterized protein n=3 Tax=Pyricularia oryzae TaxID=318829 RepID=G4MLT3_PYRO7|nr:uncharacterized protein MGG_16367 [Pyricularia oryzae 70-15]EHA57711.1 hypothetical protein MGG_16367 [Pyricularia oryzae 70-15]KAI7915195.1 hypothetical protein M9X92_008536 [Pyricularia oryzae]KAI7917325.1 hypothetical protein M0657_008154 [Pyricularia oryzae]